MPAHRWCCSTDTVPTCGSLPRWPHGWRRQVGVIAVDHRGFGRSSAVPSTFGFGGLVDDVATVLDGLDLFEAVVVGHSRGGGGGARPGDRTARRHRRSRSCSRRGQQLGAGPADRPLARAKVAVLDWAVTEQASRHRRLGMVAAERTSAPIPPQPRHGGAEDRARQPAARRHGLSRRLLGIDLSDRLSDVRVPLLALAGPIAPCAGRSGGSCRPSPVPD